MIAAWVLGGPEAIGRHSTRTVDSLMKKGYIDSDGPTQKALDYVEARHREVVGFNPAKKVRRLIDMSDEYGTFHDWAVEKRGTARRPNPADIASVLDLSFSNLHLDTIGRPGAYEHKYQLVTELDSEVVGIVDYTLFNEKVHIDWIEVAKGHKRKGIASAMICRLEAEWPDKKFVWGMTTPEGTALYESLQR